MKTRSLLLSLLLVACSMTFAVAQCNCEINQPATQTICVGETINFYANCTSICFDNNDSYWSNGPNGLSNPVTFLYPGTYSFAFAGFCNGSDPNNCGNGTWDFTTNVQVTVLAQPSSPQLSSNKYSVCGEETVTLSVTNTQSNYIYYWASDDGQTASGTTVNMTAGANGSEATSFTVTSNPFHGHGGCASSSEYPLTITSFPEIYNVVSTGNYRRAKLRAFGFDPSETHYWQYESPGTPTLTNTSISDPVAGNTLKNTTTSGTYYIRRRNIGGACWSAASTPVTVAIDQAPPAPTVIQTKSYGYNVIDLDIPDETFTLTHAVYYFQPSASTSSMQTDKPWHTGYKIFSDGTYNIRGRDESGTWGPVTTFSVTLRKDYDLNSIRARAFDGSGDEVLIGESKKYFDYGGKGLQSQIKTIATARIFVTQDVRDQFERTVGITLPAPLAGSEFRYNSLFTLNTDGGVFSYNDFNNSAAFATDQPGTLGWYYSSNNTDEPNTPETAYPYTRSVLYADGSGKPMMSARAGEAHRIGSGHEALNGTFPVYNELDDYLNKRATLLSGITQGSSLLHQAVQSITRDENGKYSISIADKGGKAVMAARSGTSTQYVLDVTNSVTADSQPASSTYNPLAYFYILSPQTISITGSGTYQIENIVTNQVITPSGTWDPGFYRVKALTGSVSFSYTNYYLDISYQFYDDAGRLVVSVSPNGYDQWANKGISVSLIDKTIYKYNYQGRLLEMTEPDAGTTKYGYRKDGKIRFSQNAKQLAANPNRYSYTNYDALGRPVESGEYAPMGSTKYFDNVRFDVASLDALTDSWMDTGPRYDWIKTHYDIPSTTSDRPGFSFPAGYNQKFTRGGVSWTENKNMLSYYSYNEKGQVIWMIQRPKPVVINGSLTLSLNKSFLLQYHHDFSGNVLDVTYAPMDNSGNFIATEMFVHYYEYDASKRLIRTLSSTDGVNKKLRARYYYYLHGPLKRIELGDKLQGIDFIYNIHGWLTAINDPNTANDPGGDGYAGPNHGFRKDAFGMVLDYYESTMGNLFTSKLEGDPDHYHHIPDLLRNQDGLAASNNYRTNDLIGNNESWWQVKRVMDFMKNSTPWN